VSAYHQPIFSLQGVSQQFGSLLALAEIDLHIYPGERVALIGPSGAGKTTLLKLLNGTQLPTQGDVWVLGQNLARLSPRKLRQIQRQIGTVYQQLHLVENLRVIHNVNAGHLGRWPLWKAAVSLVRPLAVETARQALTNVGIPEKLYARTDRLSGGQQQRVALARVLVQDPLAILADEPISSLDPHLGREVMDLLHRMTEQRGKTLVASLHSVDLARDRCDRLIGLRDGRLVFDRRSDRVSSEALAQLYQ